VCVCVCVMCVCVCVRDLDGDALCRNVFSYSRDELVPVDLNATFDIFIQDSQLYVRIELTLRRVRVSIVVVKKK